MNGIRVWHGGRFSAESLSLQLNGSGSKNLEFIDALYVGQGDESKYKKSCRANFGFWSNTHFYSGCS